MTNGVSSFLNQNLRSIQAVKTATAMPSIYNPVNTSEPCSGKKAPTSNTYIGIRAEQLMKGLMRMVMSRLERLSMILVDMMAGTLQPKPITRGMNDFPWSPILCISLSMMNATLAI